MKVENVRLMDRTSSKKPVLGTLYLTATHVIFVENVPETRKETWILHSEISSIEKQATTAGGCPLLIRCKNFQVLHLVVPQERDCQDVYISLLRLARPVKYEELFCFSFNPKLDKEEREQGWRLVDLREEYKRMGIPNSCWHLSDVNRDYRVCDSYPTDVYVPKSATAHIIVGSSKFRSRRRFPALSYYCKDTNASICRSSQPLSGFSARCLEDEQMLQAIRRANPGSDFMYVVDTRPKLNAMANRAAGKGYENEDNYADIKFQFIGIENIHVMRSSLQKMLEVCELRSPSMSDFLWGLENSGWLRHIKAILDAGVFIAKAVAEEGTSVLVHCSDGWDRTAQVCSVASLLLDPHYRTLKGFMVSLEILKAAKNRFWSGMYNRFEKGMQPRQSVTDYLMAVKEETQQLEEELQVLEERLEKIHKIPLSHTPGKRESKCSGLSALTTPSVVNIPQDSSGHLKPSPSRSPSQGDDDSALILTQENLKSSDPDLSANSDQESGVEDLSCRSPSGGECLPSEDSGKDPDPDEAVFLTA
ncbi:myotubularin-related protein 7 [Gracilinanus agilis]|uniref:myotubularin-related protein 7 n=1 Tax=Gracilinanus agilis TaxID=191870 RepID=UPI001CFEF4B3|nr:myotubularin-related protein 7 [Gracilinanus agilis]